MDLLYEKRVLVRDPVCQFGNWSQYHLELVELETETLCGLSIGCIPLIPHLLYCPVGGIGEPGTPKAFPT